MANPKQKKLAKKKNSKKFANKKIGKTEKKVGKKLTATFSQLSHSR